MLGCKGLTNRFHVVRLFSCGSQMTSRFCENKKVAHEAQTSVTTFWRLWSISGKTLGNMELICFIQSRGKNVLLMTSSMRLSSNRSRVKTNQNACVIQPVINFIVAGDLSGNVKSAIEPRGSSSCGNLSRFLWHEVTRSITTSSTWRRCQFILRLPHRISSCFSDNFPDFSARANRMATASPTAQ